MSNTGWGGGIRTPGTRIQSPLPYRLATPQRLGVSLNSRGNYTISSRFRHSRAGWGVRICGSEKSSC